MSKKVLITLILVIVVIPPVLIGGYFFFKNSDVSVGETISNVLPFGSGANLPLAPEDTENLPEEGSESIPDEFGAPKEKLFRLSQEPVAGAVILSGKASTTMVRYVDRATGHIYDVNLETLEKTKISNQTLPKVYEAYFRGDGKALLLRRLRDDSDVVENLSITLTAPNNFSTSSIETGSLYSATSTLLRGDIGSVSTANNNLFYTLRDNSSVVSSAFSGAGAQTLLSSPFTDWNLVAYGNSVLLYTKASASASGFAYTLGASGLTKILGPLNALIALPNASGNKILYSHVLGNETRLFVKNISTGVTAEISVPTLAEKCVWSKNTSLVYCGSPSSDIGVNEPDNWYKGISAFSDRVWSFDTESGFAKILVEPSLTLGLGVDVLEPKLSPNEDYLIFTNKADLSLWALKLFEE